MTAPPLSYLVGRADRIVRGELERELQELGVTINQVTALYALAEEPGQSNARLARRALVSPQAMHKVVRSLEEGGFIVRKASPEGGRVLETEVTPAGERLVAQALDHIEAAERRYLADLTRTEQSELRRLLNKVARLTP